MNRKWTINKIFWIGWGGIMLLTILITILHSSMQVTRLTEQYNELQTALCWINAQQSIKDTTMKIEMTNRECAALDYVTNLLVTEQEFDFIYSLPSNIREPFLRAAGKIKVAHKEMEQEIPIFTETPEL